MATDDGLSPVGTSTDSPPHPCYLIVYNVSKRHNIGTLLRCATAFNVKEVCLVGSRDFNSWGAHGSDSHVALRHYLSIAECCTDLKENKGCQVVGVEIMDSALPIDTFPFTGPVAFMLGNEGQGLSTRQLQLCDAFVYIPQFGPGTASLNVAVAASIVLHRYAAWAGYQERAREGYKFVVQERERSDRTVRRGTVPLTTAEMEELRAARQAGAGVDDAVPGIDFSEEGLPDISMG